MVWRADRLESCLNCEVFVYNHSSCNEVITSRPLVMDATITAACVVKFLFSFNKYMANLG